VTYRVETPETFLTQVNKVFRKHPDMRMSFQQPVAYLANDPFQPGLRLYPLKGTLRGVHAVSLTHSYRVTLTLFVSEKESTLLHIGSHDEVYR